MGLVYAGAAAILVLLTLWFRTQREVNQIKIAYARTPATQQAPAVVSSTPSSETAPAAASQVKPAVAISQEPLTAPAPSQTVPKPAVSQPMPEPVAANAARAATANVLPPAVAPQKKAQPDFRLSAIIYADLNPSAIVNGQRVNLGEWVDGANLVGIGRTTVTLQINSHTLHGQSSNLEILICYNRLQYHHLHCLPLVISLIYTTFLRLVSYLLL